VKLQFSQILCFACSRQGTAIVKSEKFECCQIFCCTGMVTVSLAVKCYVCGLSADCNDEYSGVQGHLVDCTNSQDGGCTKTKTITKLPGGVITTVVQRSCGKSYDNSNCKQGDRLKINAIIAKTETWQCSCDGDECNTGSGVRVGVFFIATVVLAKLVL